MKKTSQAYVYFIAVVLLFYLVGPFIGQYLLVNLNLNIGVANSITHFSIFVPAVIVFILITKSSFKEVLSIRKTPWLNILLAVALAVVCQPVMSFLANLTQVFAPDNSVTDFMGQVNSLSFMGMFFAMAVTPAITEEITMRGVILSRFNNVNVYIAATINGLLFGIFHNNSSQFLYAFALGFVLALIVRYTGSIFVSMICHMAINGTQVILSKVLVFNPKFSDEISQAQSQITPSERLAMLPALVPLVVASIVLIVLIVNGMKHISEKAENKKLEELSLKSSENQESDIRYENNESSIIAINKIPAKKSDWKLFINVWTIIIYALFIVSMISSILIK